MSESFDEQISRVRQMADGDPTWDLSQKDIAALKALLQDYDRQCRRIQELDDAMRRSMPA
jgi:hypothetical protein